jgi:hypothetical protein
MAGLVPAIHVFLCSTKKDVDARHKAGHDGQTTCANIRRSRAYRTSAMPVKPVINSMAMKATSMPVLT